jgi:hypothetical protein
MTARDASRLRPLRFRRIMAPKALGITALVLALAVPARAVELAPHRAFYNLHLDLREGAPSDVISADGGMAIEVRETCDGWITNQRLLLSISRGEDEPVVTDNNFTSWESTDGLKYRFSVRDKLNGDVSEELRGDAHLDSMGGPGVASFTAPARKDVVLPRGALFPTAHVAHLLDAAKGGERFFARTVFDGTAIEGPDLISAVIGRAKPLETVPGLEALAGHLSWPMRWAFFPAGDDSPLPDYELTVRMLENGVVVELGLVYEDFRVSGKIDRFVPLERPKC